MKQFIAVFIFALGTQSPAAENATGGSEKSNVSQFPESRTGQSPQNQPHVEKDQGNVKSMTERRLQQVKKILEELRQDETRSYDPQRMREAHQSNAPNKVERMINNRSVTPELIDSFFNSPKESIIDALFAEKLAFLEQGADSYDGKRASEVLNEQKALIDELKNPDPKVQARAGRKARALAKQYKRLLSIRTLDLKLSRALDEDQEFRKKRPYSGQLTADDVDRRASLQTMNYNLNQQLSEFHENNSRPGKPNGAKWVQLETKTLFSKVKMAAIVEKMKQNPAAGNTLPGLTAEDPIPDYSPPGSSH